MPKSGERAYAYAKACGIIGKSFVGKRIAGLESVSRLSDLDRLVFPQSHHELPERELLVDLERRIIGRSAEQIIAIVNAFSKPPELLIRLLRSYEYADLKNALAAIAYKEAKTPSFTDLERFAVVNFRAYPDIKAMVHGTEFEFLATETFPKGEAGSIIAQTKLDKHYYSALWDSLYQLSHQDRAGIETVLAEEISLRNVVWTLRLRTYYLMEGEEVQEKLVDLTPKARLKGQKGEPRSLMADAEACLDLPLDTYAPWASWKRVEFLNTDTGDDWKADPRYFQNASSRHLYQIARHYFRLHPFSIDTAACFIKLKQFEEDLLTSVSEGLGIGMSSRDVVSLLELRQ
jgi:vacuolar-type H+-ATPase subunit C/Vma6